MKRNEIFKGNLRDIEKIKSFLDKERKKVPKRFKKHIQLGQAIKKDALGIDWKLFDAVVKEAEKYFKDIDENFSLMPRDRYLIALPREDSVGGFYGRPAGGYYYFNDLGFGTTLNENSAPNKTLRTLDLARSYLHDSLHASTFRTFRVDQETGMIFRHQYGINFRNANRVSYSAPNANESSPNPRQHLSCMIYLMISAQSSSVQMVRVTQVVLLLIHQIFKQMVGQRFTYFFRGF